MVKKIILGIGGLFVFILVIGAMAGDGNKKTEQESKATPSAEPTVNSLTTSSAITDIIQETKSVEEKIIVTKVTDGDTIQLNNGNLVRYIGIDAPETVHPQKPVECFGQEASNKNKELVEGKEIRLEKDVSETDKYGRLLRYVWVGDIFVNDYLVRQGYAHASTYPPDIKYQKQFSEAEKEARDNNRGLWGKCTQEVTTTPTTTSETNQPTPTLTTPPPFTSNTYTGGDKDCPDFTTQQEAQAFFISQGGPASDPHRLDRDKDGIACETLP